MGDVTSALIGLGGVIVGGGITAASGQLTERARAKRADQERDRAERDEATVLGRVLLDDLAVAHARLHAARRQDNQRFWTAAMAPPLTTWQEHRGEVARQMPADGWAAVALFFRTLRTLEARAEAARDGRPGARPPLGTKDTYVLNDAIARLRPAQKALEEFTRSTMVTDETAQTD